MLIGQVATSYFSQESQIVLSLSQPKNFSESLYNIEYVIIDNSSENFDQIHSFDINNITIDNPFSVKDLSITIKKIYTDTSKETKAITAIAEISLGGSQQETKTFSSHTENLYKIGNYRIGLRRSRFYLPFSVFLTDFIKENYPKTTIPKAFSSTVNFYTEDGEYDYQTTITMNHPISYQGRTFYQSGFSSDETTSILHVVENPIWISPYLSSAMITIGLFYHFFILFIRQRHKKGEQ